MTFNLEQMLDLRENVSGRSSRAKMYFSLPWVGPAAFLHTIFEPGDPILIERASRDISIPPLWQEFLSSQNGADLYLNSLYIVGVNEPNQLQIRNSADRRPFDIEEQNLEARLPLSGEWLQVGVYGHSGSLLLLSRNNGRVVNCDSSQDRTLLSWTGVNEWLQSELKRLASIFSSDGRILTDERFTEPSQFISDFLMSHN